MLSSAKFSNTFTKFTTPKKQQSDLKALQPSHERNGNDITVLADTFIMPQMKEESPKIAETIHHMPSAESAKMKTPNQKLPGLNSTYTIDETNSNPLLSTKDASKSPILPSPRLVPILTKSGTVDVGPCDSVLIRKLDDSKTIDMLHYVDPEQEHDNSSLDDTLTRNIADTKSTLTKSETFDVSREDSLLINSNGFDTFPEKNCNPIASTISNSPLLSPKPDDTCMVGTKCSTITAAKSSPEQLKSVTPPLLRTEPILHISTQSGIVH